MARKITLQDVAERSGVSLATVDRVVNRRGGVTPDKERKVLAAARALGLDRRLAIAPSRILRVAVLIQPRSNPFHAEFHAEVAQVRNVHAALNIQLQVAAIDPNRPDRTAAEIRGLSGACDGLIVCAPDSPEIARAIAEVSPRLKVVTLATDISDCGRAAYVGPDDERSGRVAGDLMGRLTRPGGGNVLVLAGRLDIAGHLARARGFRALLEARHPHCTISRVMETGEAFERTSGLVRRALQDDPEIAGIYHLSVGTIGIAEALEGLGRGGDVVVISHELTPNRRRLLRERKLDVVLDQNPRLEMRLAVETMARLLGRLDGDAGSIETEVRIFMAENA